MGEAVEEAIVVVQICDDDDDEEVVSIVSSSSVNNNKQNHFMIMSFANQNQIMPTPLTNSLSLINTNSQISDWLPITASRNGNACYAAFHAITSGIGIQALMLPVAFATLGWTWGIICLSLLFSWQFYTIWLLIQLHESVSAAGGTRYDRYIQLSKAAFGEKLGKLLGIFPVMYLSGGSCVILIMIAGDTMKLFIKIATKSEPLTTVECYLLFIFLAILLNQFLPNLNSIAWISFIGSLAAVLYCTLLWAIAVSKSRPTDISYVRVNPARTDGTTAFSVLNALGIIALAFRGHNLILEIQATMPTSGKKTSLVPMWRGIKFAYLLIAFCLFPLAIGGFWAYGNKIPTGVHGGMLYALHKFHQHDTSRFVLTLISLLVLIHCICSFQIYAMPTLDNLAFAYSSRKKKPCSTWIKVGLRVFFGCLTFFIAVAIPFLRGLAGLIGGIALPLTLAYPCFMWITIKKPKPYRAMWCINMLLGSIGMILSVLVSAGGIWSLVHPGIHVRFFNP